MMRHRCTRALLSTLLAGAFALAFWTVAADAQQARTAGESAYRRYAPVDLTGMWVSIVTEEWAQRMLTPPKGDFQGLPLTQSAQDAANAIDMARVAAEGRACDAYGAPAIMRQPGRIRIGWADGNTLRVETDAGQQVRLLHFDGAGMTRRRPSRQGFSVAEWQYAGGFDLLRTETAAREGGAAPTAKPSGGKLKVITSSLTAGFLRKNGVPYSADTTMTEYYNLLTEPDGKRWIIITTVLRDPANLAVDYITSTNLREEPDSSKWHPQPCSLN